MCTQKYRRQAAACLQAGTVSSCPIRQQLPSVSEYVQAIAASFVIFWFVRNLSSILGQNGFPLSCPVLSR